MTNSADREDQPVLFVNGPNILSDVYETEAVVVNLDSGCYFSIQGAGVFIWKAIQAGGSAKAIVKEAQAHFTGAEDEIIHACYDFIATLKAENLVTSGGGNAGFGPSSPPATPSSFEAPVIEKYTDMQDLFLLDPVHEVDGAGWPKQASPEEITPQVDPQNVDGAA